MQWLTDLTAWITSLIKGLWTDWINWLNDAWIDISQTILSSVADTVYMIPSPDFLTAYSMSNLFNALPSDFIYFISFMHFPECFALLGLAFTFRMTRKVFTLFQW